MNRHSMMVLPMVLFSATLVPIEAQAQKNKPIKLDFKKVSLADALKKLQKASGYQILFTYDDVKQFTVEGPVVARNIDEALAKLFGNKPFAYSVDGKYVSVLLVEKATHAQPKAKSSSQKTYKLKGMVYDSEMMPLPGASVSVVGTKLVSIADEEGRFSIDLPDGKKTTVTFSYIGMKTATRTFNGPGKGNIYVSLRNDTQLDDVVVTGMFDRRKESFTGATTTFTKDELLTVGNQNLLSSLKNLDPAFQITDNLDMGSDPNNMPNVKVRGETSFNIQGDYEGNQNQPLFILDGFETTIEKIYDLDMNRIQSVTILKDAAAKAIYGSKAGNGVVVVQTIRPKSGEMRISYNGNLNIEAPDLTGYNMMNAQEKFDWEKAHHKYDGWQAMKGAQAADELYKSVYDAIQSGVDTYWLSKPLRTGIGQKHSVSLEGGDSKIRYIVGLSYNNIAGVMKKSSRNTLNINSTLSYTYKNMVFRNQLDYNRNTSKNSPYGSFSDYIGLEPYFAPYDANGNLKQILGYECVNNSYPVYNPLYNAQLNTKDESNYTSFTDNFDMDWHINENFRFTARFSYTRQESGSDLFYPASHTMFAEYDANGQSDRKGRYTKTNGYQNDISAQVGLNYNKMIGKHAFFFNGTWNLQSTNNGSTTVMAEGFGNDNMDDISMATYYYHNSHPTGSDSKTREIGLIGAFNYSYADRYLFDASYRATGSSVYGSDNHWGGFWSLGAGWNIHNEKWFGEESPIKLLKLRYSLGYTGTQNFNPYQARAKYSYSGNFYDGRMGATLLGLPNTKLKWQKVWDSNLGLDLAIKEFLTLRAEYYTQKTDNMLIDITLPGSTGFQTYKENMGEIENRGYEIALGITPWRDNKNRGWFTFTATAMHNKNTIKKIYDIFKKSNDDADKNFSSEKNDGSHSVTVDEANAYLKRTTRPATKYYEGCSMTAIWGVRSLGIDPMTGKEMFLDKNGDVTYTWSSDDQVIIGDTNPKLQGTLGISAGWAGWTFSAIASYKMGGDLYNSTLIDRVENITGYGNLDKRVNDTWANPGDHTLFKQVQMGQSPADLAETTKPTSRFVQKNNELYLSSINLGYDFYKQAWLKKLGLEYLKLSFTANDLVRMSSIKIERGTSYPYARTFSFSVNATF